MTVISIIVFESSFSPSQPPAPVILGRSWHRLKSSLNCSMNLLLSRQNTCCSSWISLKEQFHNKLTRLFFLAIDVIKCKQKQINCLNSIQLRLLTLLRDHKDGQDVLNFVCGSAMISFALTTAIWTSVLDPQNPRIDGEFDYCRHCRRIL